MADKHLDEAIDRAVRDLMSADADAQFRARVLSRIRTAPVASSWTSLRLVTAAAAVALLLLTILVWRMPQPVPASRQVAREGRAVPVPSPAPDPTAEPPQAAAPRETRAGQRSLQRPALERRKAPSPPRDTAAPIEAIAALDEIAPLAMAPLQPAGITPPAIVVAPIAPIGGLQVDPLGGK